MREPHRLAGPADHLQRPEHRLRVAELERQPEPPRGHIQLRRRGPGGVGAEGRPALQGRDEALAQQVRAQGQPGLALGDAGQAEAGAAGILQVRAEVAEREQADSHPTMRCRPR